MKRHLRFALTALSAAMLAVTSGCATNPQIAQATSRALPASTVTNYDAAIACLARHANNWAEANNRRILIAVDEMPDRTLNPNSQIAQGILAFSGKEIFESITTRYLNPHRFVVPISMPLEIKQYFDGYAVDRALYETWLRTYGVDMVIAVSGSFAGADQNIQDASRSLALNGGGGDVDVDASVATHSGADQVRAILKAGQIATNRTDIVVDLKGWRIQNSRNAGLSLSGYGVGGISGQFNVALSDGMHALQGEILAAAWYSIFNGLVPNAAAADCLTQSSPRVANDAMESFARAGARERIMMLQRAINAHPEMKNWPPVDINGELDWMTWEYIKIIEKKLHLLPHDADTLGSLYVKLLNSGSQS